MKKTTKLKTRKLTVCRKKRILYQGSYIYTPDIRLSGVWMLDAGFRTGQIISIKCTNRQLIIKPISEPTPEPEFKPEGWKVHDQ